MNTFKSLSDIWKCFDDIGKKHFIAEDVSVAINNLQADISERTLCVYEAMAFGFSGNDRKNKWGTYYGPRVTFKRKDNGEEAYSPDIKDITEEMMAHWEHRCSIVKNPILKARYTGLVLEFKKKLFGKGPDYKYIKLAHVLSLLDIVDKDYCQYETVAFDLAERALFLAISFKNSGLQEMAVNVYYNAHLRHSNDDMSPGVWGRIFQSLIKHRTCFGKYEQALIDEQLARYDRIHRLAIEKGDKTDSFVHVLCEQAELLADYYHSIGKKELIEPYLDGILEAIKTSIAYKGGMWGQNMIQQLQHRYRKYGFDQKANQLFVELQDLGEMTLGELKATEFRIPLDSEMIKAFLDEALKGSNWEVLQNFLFQYLPKLEDEKKRLKDKAEQAPLFDLVTTFTIDSSGNTISRVGVGPNAEHQKLYFSMYENMRLITPFMHLHITKMKETGKMTLESMLQLFNDSLLITDDHKEIVRRGLEAYMNEDHLVCCHLLVPQFEAAIRRLFQLNGVNTMRPKADPSEGNEYLSLDSLLGSDAALQFMKEDIANYFRNVLTDQYGWNIRNLVSHGLLGTGHFSFGMADRLVHAFLILSTFKEKE